MSVLDTDQQVQQLAVAAVLEGAKPTYSGDNAIYPIDKRYMPLDYAKLLVSKGATVERMPLFVEINSADDSVTAGLTGATVTDDEGNESPVTWTEWCDATHSVITVGDRLFVGTNAHSGQDIALNDLVAVFDSLISLPDMQALVAANEPDQPE